AERRRGAHAAVPAEELESVARRGRGLAAVDDRDASTEHTVVRVRREDRARAFVELRVDVQLVTRVRGAERELVVREDAERSRARVAVLEREQSDTDGRFDVDEEDELLRDRAFDVLVARESRAVVDEPPAALGAAPHGTRRHAPHGAGLVVAK